MAYVALTKVRYAWNIIDEEWNSIGTAGMSMEEIVDVSTADAPRVDEYPASTYYYVRGAYHRETNHQLWLSFGRYSGVSSFRLCYLGVNGSGVIDDDAELVKSWVFTHLTLSEGHSWPDKWSLAPVVVVPDPPVVVPDPVSPSVEEADFGHLRTQFRRQSILRRRNA